MSVVRCRVPLRISFGGGGTDVEPYPSAHGGATLNVTIGRYVYCSIVPTHDDEIRLESEDLNIASTFHVGTIPLFDGQLDLVKAVLARVNPGWRKGLHMRLQSDAPPGSGLGASSALVVASILGVARFLGVYMAPGSVAKLAYDIERHDLGILGGYQDQYAAAFGGLNWTEYTKAGVFVSPLGVPPDVIMELEYNFLLWYTGTSHVSGGILKEQIENYENDISVVERLHRLKALAADMRDALLRGKIADFGALMDASWSLKRRLARSISSEHIEMLYEAGCKAGALGEKVLGAGGGGFLLFVVPASVRAQVIESLSRVGGRYGGALHLDLLGPRVWTSPIAISSSPAFILTKTGG